SDATPPRQELGRGRRPDRTRGSILVRERPVHERFPERDAGTRGPVTAAFPARAGRAEPGVPDGPASLAPESGERGRGDPAGRRAGAREDGRGNRGEQGRGDEDVRQRDARGEVRRGAPQAPPEDLTLMSRG